MSIQPRHFRIFIASPGDVLHERELALAVLDQLSYEPSFRGRITIEEVAWDKKGAGAPILANLTPQDSIEKGLPKPSDCDIVVVIFWARMGTPLPAQYKKKDGSRYLSGTEWEYEDAIHASEKQGTPEVLLYRRTEPLLLNPDDSDFDEKTRQYRLVKTFFDSFINPDGSIRYGHNSYGSPNEFKELLEFHLKTIIQRLLRESEKTHSTDRSVLPPPWPKSPFPGLRAFTPEDAPIFFGRQRETDALIRKVEKNRVVAIVGASGSGKSSLVGAGLIPQLLLTTGNQGWVPISTTPDYLGNGDPFAALSAALLRDLSNIKSKGLAATLLSDPESLAKILTEALAKKQPKLLKDKTAAVRQICVIELASFGTPEVLTSLSEALSGTDNDIRPACVQVLGILGSKYAERGYYYFRGVISDVVRMPYCDDYLYDPLESALRRAEGKLVKTIASSGAMKALMQCLLDEDDKVRALAASALGKIGSNLAIGPLSRLLKDEKSPIREGAIKALGNINDKKVVGVLIGALSSKHMDVRAQSADLLGELGNRTADKEENLGNFRDHVFESKAPYLLLEALKSESIKVRRSAVKALGKIGLHEAAIPIASFLQDKDSELRANVVEALGKLNDTSVVRALADALKDGALEVRTNAVKALGNLGDSSVLPNILALPMPATTKYRERELKLALILALGKLGDDSVVSTLAEALRDSDWRISQAAAHSLKQLKSPAAHQVLSEYGHSVN
jgi:HEAT repeat protein